MKPPVRFLLSLALFALAGAASLSAQGPGCPGATLFPCGEVQKLAPDSARVFREQLRKGRETDLPAAMSAYFAKAYSPRLIDWIVFIGKDSNNNPIIRQGLATDGSLITDQYIRGSQSISVLVFSETNLAIAPAPSDPKNPKPSPAEQTASQVSAIGKSCQAASVACAVNLSLSDDSKKSASPDTAIELYRSTLQYTKDPTITGFVKALSKGIAGDGGGSASAIIPDSLLYISLTDVVLHDHSPADTISFWVGLKRISLPNNAVARLTVRPHNPGCAFAFPSATSVSYSVENASASSFGASISLGVTAFAPDTGFAIANDSSSVLIKSKSSQLKPNLWLLAHLYLSRPQLPIHPISVSVVAGTNVGISDLFRDLLMGISVDRLFSDVGIVGGINYIERQTATSTEAIGGKIVQLGTRNYRSVRPFLGLDISL